MTTPLQKATEAYKSHNGTPCGIESLQAACQAYHRAMLEREGVAERVAARIRDEYKKRGCVPQCYANMRSNKQYDEADIHAQACLDELKRIAGEE